METKQLIMVDITHKQSTLRIATAQAIVQVSRQETIQAIQNKTVPKGDVFAMSKASGLIGVKKTPELLPDCHPLPIEFTGFDFQIDKLEIKILCTVKTVYKTGVEVEAMHGASIAALNIYDMLKPIDKGVVIEQIKLVSKKGGKSDYIKPHNKNVKAAVVVCSDSVSAGKKEDRSGKAIVAMLKEWEVTVEDYVVIPDAVNTIREKVEQYSKIGVSMVIFTGGTGLSPRDQTPEALRPLIDREIKGIEETIRNYGQQRMPFAMLSRSVAGMVGDTLVLAFPGSLGGVKDSMHAIFPAVLHLFEIIKGAQHNN